MKKNFLFFLFAISIFSCKKDDNNSVSNITKSIKFTLDGKSYEFTNGVSGQKDTTQGFGVKYFHITGSSTANTDNAKITLQKYSNSILFTGTYSLNLGSFPDYFPQLELTINGQKYSANAPGSLVNASSSFVVTVNTDDNKTASGTFNGDLYPTNSSNVWTGGAKKVITGGSFNIAVN